MAIGPAVVFLAVVLEYSEYRLGGMAVGFGLAVVGVLLSMGNAVGTGPSPTEEMDRTNRDG